MRILALTIDIQPKAFERGGELRYPLFLGVVEYESYKEGGVLRICIYTMKHFHSILFQTEHSSTLSCIYTIATYVTADSALLPNIRKKVISTHAS